MLIVEEAVHLSLPVCRLLGGSANSSLLLLNRLRVLTRTQEKMALAIAEDHDKNVTRQSTKCSPQSAQGTISDAQTKDKYQAKNVCATARNTSKDTSKVRACHRDLRADKDRRKQFATQVKRPETPANTRRSQTEENSSNQNFAQSENQQSGAGDKTVAVTLALEVDRDLDAVDCPLFASLALDGLKRALKEWLNPCNRTLSKECDTPCNQSDVRMCEWGDSSRDPCEGLSRNK